MPPPRPSIGSSRPLTFAVKKFHIEQVIAFRRWLDEVTSAREGKPLSKATSLQILNAIRAFMLWLADQSGYRSRIRYSDAAYFRLSEKDARIAKASTACPIPTPEQIECVSPGHAGQHRYRAKQSRGDSVHMADRRPRWSVGLLKSQARRLDRRASESGPARGED